jgi:hypothetical protein
MLLQLHAMELLLSLNELQDSPLPNMQSNFSVQADTSQRFVTSSLPRTTDIAVTKSRKP